MGIIKTITAFLLLCLVLPCKAQKDSAIPWNTHKKLTWADFRGTPVKTARAAATTASGISYEYTAQEKGEGYEVDFKIGAFFYPDKSWYQRALCDEFVLGHEQLHFDISELYARKMSKIMAETRFTKNAQTEIKAIYKSILKDLSAFQSRYDHETNYSRDREKQMAWEKKVAAALLKGN